MATMKLTPELLQMACDVMAEMHAAECFEAGEADRVYRRWHGLREELESLSHEYGSMIQEAIDAARDVCSDMEEG